MLNREPTVIAWGQYPGDLERKQLRWCWDECIVSALAVVSMEEIHLSSKSRGNGEVDMQTDYLLDVLLSAQKSVLNFEPCGN